MSQKWPLKNNSMLIYILFQISAVVEQTTSQTGKTS